MKKSNEYVEVKWKFKNAAVLFKFETEDVFRFSYSSFIEAEAADGMHFYVLRESGRDFKFQHKRYIIFDRE